MLTTKDTMGGNLPLDSEPIEAEYNVVNLADDPSGPTPRTPVLAVVANPGGTHGPDAEPRINTLEGTLARIEAIIVRIDKLANYGASKADLAAMRAELRAALKTKATRATVWAMGVTFLVVALAALAAAAVYWPYLVSLLPHARQ